MKPVIILPPDTMTPADIKEMRDNGFCVVESKDPATVKFIDPLPAMSSRTEMENACIKLSRKVFAGQVYNESTMQVYHSWFIKILIEGTPLDSRPTQQEREKEVFDQAKYDALRQLAREEAKAERDAEKKAKAEKEAAKKAIPSKP